MTAPPRDAGRLIVAERSGVLRLLVDGTRQATPFLDISDRVSCCAGERGLGSIAFAPDYGTSGLLFACYTAKSPTGAITISEFRRSASNPNAADPASERILVQIPHDQQTNHDGGQLQFGPDGLLYAGTGDGGSGGDPAGNGQNLDSSSPAVVGGVNHDPRLGKLLRIDPARGASEIFAYGLRNPWRFSFDRQTGDLVIGDVGQNGYEEVDFLAAGTPSGANFGWNRYEGRHTYPGGAAVSPPYPDGFTFPVLERSHDADGVCSITGGYVVRDPGLPDLAGRYVYGDYCDSSIRSAVLGAGGATDDKPTGLTVSNLSTFGEDACGRVYVASIGGAVYRLSQGAAACAFPADGSAPVASAPIPAPAPRLSLWLRLSPRQHAVRTRRVSLAAGCLARCTVTASGRIRVTKVAGSYRLRSAKAIAPARAYRSLKLRLGPVTQRSLRRSLARNGRRATATVLVTARDAAGRKRTRTARIRLLR